MTVQQLDKAFPEPASTLKDAQYAAIMPPRQPNVIAGMLKLWDHRQLIQIMVLRDLIGRYRGSLMGAFWPIINPMGHLLLYTFVFNVILKVRFTNDPSIGNFALYFMTGLIPWGAFSEAVSRSTTVILEVPNLVKRVVFPVEVLPVVLVISGIMSQAIAATVLLAAVLLITHALPTWKLGLLPLVMMPQLLFSAGVCWLLSSLGVYIRDLRHVIALALSAWMFTTPIAYPASAFPANLKFILWLNPIAGIVADYRRIILEHHMPNWPVYALYATVSVLTCLIGFTFFYRTKRSFADVM